MGIRYYFNPDDLAYAVRDVLSADTTLRGSSYLNSTDARIFTGSLPRDSGDRSILVEVGAGMNVSEMQTYSLTVRVHCYVPLLSNNQIDPKVHTILERCEQLLNGNMITITNARCRPLYSEGCVPAYFDEYTGVNKAHGILLLTCHVDPD